MTGSTGKRWLPVLILLAGTLAVSAPFLLPGRSLFAGHTDRLQPWTGQATEEQKARAEGSVNKLLTDKLLMFHPEVALSRKEFRSGRMPGWNPWVLGGLPHIATGIPSTFAPLMTLHVLLDPFRAYGVVAALYLFVAGLFLYLFFRAIGLSRPGGILGAAAFAFGGWMAARMEYYQLAGAAAWVPMVLYGLELHLASGKKRYAAFVSLGVGFSFLSGFPQITIEAGYLFAAYGLYRFPALYRSSGAGPAFKRVIVCGLAGALGVLIAAPQMIPSAVFTLSGASTRGLAGFDSIRAMALGPGALSSFLSPFTMGHPFLPDWASSPLNTTRTLLGEAWFASTSSNFIEITAYLGIITPCLLLGIPRILRARGGAFFLAAALVSVLAALDTPVLFLSVHLPGLNIGDPKRYLFITVLALSAAAAIAFDRHLEAPEKERLSWGPAAAALILALGAFGLLLWVRSGRAFQDYLVSALSARHGIPEAEVLHYVGRDGLENAVRHVAGCLKILGFSAAAAGGVLLLSGWRKTPVLLRAGLPLVFLLVDLSLFSHGINKAQHMENFNRPNPLVTHLKERQQEGPFRIVRYKDTDTGKESVMPPKLPMLSEIEDVQGYVAVYLNRYRNLIDGIEQGLTMAVGMLSFKESGSMNSPLFDLLGARFVITRDMPLDPGGKFQTAGIFDGVMLLENKAALPRAFVVRKVRTAADDRASLAAVLDPDFRPREEAVIEGRVDTSGWNTDPATPTSARIVRHGASSVEVAVESGGGLLVLTENHYPGWKAEVDGSPAPIFYTDHAFRGVPVPPGAHTVCFRFRSYPVFIGLVLGLMGFAATLFLFLRQPKKK